MQKSNSEHELKKACFDHIMAQNSIPAGFVVIAIKSNEHVNIEAMEFNSHTSKVSPLLAENISFVQEVNTFVQNLNHEQGVFLEFVMQAEPQLNLQVIETDRTDLQAILNDYINEVIKSTQIKTQEVVAELPQIAFGDKLALSIAEALLQKQFCPLNGMSQMSDGFHFDGHKFCYSVFLEGAVIYVIKQFNSKELFVEWLSQQSESSLSLLLMTEGNGPASFIKQSDIEAWLLD
jgi:hypothetical protein